MSFAFDVRVEEVLSCSIQIGYDGVTWQDFSTQLHANFLIFL